MRHSPRYGLAFARLPPSTRGFSPTFAPRCGPERHLAVNPCRVTATPGRPLLQRPCRGGRWARRDRPGATGEEAHLRQSGTVDQFGVDSTELILLGALALLLLAALGRALWKRRLQRLRDEDQIILLFPDAPAPAVARAAAKASQPPPADDIAPAPAEAPFEVPRQPAVPPATRTGNGVTRPPPVDDGDGRGEFWVPAAFAAPDPIEDVTELATTNPGIGPTRAASPLPGVPSTTSRPLPGRSSAQRQPVEFRPPVEAAVDEASQTIRLPTAADGTVQILPGRLVMRQGPEVGREYRFLRVGSQPVPEVTLGRASGSPYLHIQLPAPTVSRLHARMRYEGGGWKIINLSQTNPVQVNGRELPMDAPVPLVDGDHIVLGEVELSYQIGRP